MEYNAVHMLCCSDITQSRNSHIFHASCLAQTKHQVEGGLLLDVVVSERATVLQLLAGEDQTLLVRRDALLVLEVGKRPS